MRNLILIVSLVVISCPLVVGQIVLEEHWDDGDWTNNPTWFEYDNIGPNFAINHSMGHDSTPALEGWSRPVFTDYTALYTPVGDCEAFTADFWVHKRRTIFSNIQIGFSEGAYSETNQGFMVKIIQRLDTLWYMEIRDVDSVLIFEGQIQYDDNRWTNISMIRTNTGSWEVIWDYNGPHELIAYVQDSFVSFADPYLWVHPDGYCTVQEGGFYLDDILITCEGGPCPAEIAGFVTPYFEGLTVNLYDDSYEFISSTLTAFDGSFSFPDLDPGDYYVELIPPLGYVAIQNNILVSAIECETIWVDFELTPTVISNQARTVGYWMHQVRTNLTGHGRPHHSLEELEDFAQDIFDNFYMNPVQAIQVEGVTFVGDPASPLDIYDLEEMLFINQGAGTMNERARRQFLALLLNVASGKLGLYFQASEDSATVSQAIVYVDSLLGFDDELAKDIAETLNKRQIVDAGVIPLTIPNTIFGSGGNSPNIPIKGGNTPAMEAALLPESFEFSGPFPNPFNPTTTFSFGLPEAARVSLIIYDILGRQVATLANGWCDAGSHKVTFDGSEHASGIYIAYLQVEGISQTRKMVLVK